MEGLPTLVMALLCMIGTEAMCSRTEDCWPDSYSPGFLRISITSKRNQTGKWVTEFSAQKDDSEIGKANELAVDLSHGVMECGEKRTLVLRGKISDYPMGNESAEIRFHPRVGINVAIKNNGRSVEKIILTETAHGLAFTNRPLMDNELFEVILEKKSSHFKNSLGIGASPYHPDKIMMEKHITDLQPPSWSMYYGDLYHNKNVVKKSYGRSLDTVEVGDRVGIMRRSTGSLHYFVNGSDQGPAATGVPSQIYGVIELYANAARATIRSRT